MLNNKTNKVITHMVEEVYLADNLYNSLLSNRSLTDGFSEEDKQKAMNFINKEESKPSLLDKGVNAASTGAFGPMAQSVGKNLLKSKESSKTVSKKVNQMEKPVQKSTQKPSVIPEKGKYVKAIDTPEKAEKATQEAVQKINTASDDKSSWETALKGLGFAKDVAKSIWDELGDASNRVDWLTTLTVYAASRYMGNNGGLAVANGLMRGMESKAKQQQLQAAMEAGQAEAQQEQQNFERQMAAKEFEANTGRMNANTNLLKAKQDAAQKLQQGATQLSSDDNRIIDAVTEDKGYEKSAVQQAAAMLKQQGQPITAGNLRNAIEKGKDEGLFETNLFGNSAKLR